LQGVQEAFIASGIAIFFAILITLIEKWLLNWCYRQTEALAQAVDTLYEAGAGEEYLSRLVGATEESAVQTRHLKDALVNDLKELLTNFSGSLAHAVEHSLREPMQKIADATQTLGGNQGEAVDKLLANTIEKLQGTFGNQMDGLNGVMTQNTDLMRGMQSGFRDLLDKLAAAGADANTALAEQLRQLTVEAKERQETMNNTMLGLLDQLRAIMAQTQQEGAVKLNESLAGIMAAVERLMGDLAKQREAMDETGRQGLDHLREGLAALIEEFGLLQPKPARSTALNCRSCSYRRKAASRNSTLKSGRWSSRCSVTRRFAKLQ